VRFSTRARHLRGSKEAVSSHTSEDSSLRYTGSCINELVAHLKNRALILPVCAISVLTLAPFQFFAEETADRRRAPFLLWLSPKFGGWLPFCENIVLFIPFGFGLAVWIENRVGSRVLRILAIVAAGFGFSFTMEVLQSFLVPRGSSWDDVVSNTTGALLGYFVFCIAGARILQFGDGMEAWIERLCGGGIIVAMLVSYTALGLTASWQLQKMASLKNWDAEYPIFLGNDSTGQKPWAGRIVALTIRDRALTWEAARRLGESSDAGERTPSIVTFYHVEQDRHGQNAIWEIPDLLWFPHQLPVQESMAVFDGSSWVRTKANVESLVQRLEMTNQFTVELVGAANVNTGDFEPIVLLGTDPTHFDLVLGQDGDNLIFRFRTPLAKNSSEPSLIAPDVFQPNRMRDILLAYDGADLSLYLDGKRDSHGLVLGPGAALFRRIFRLRMYNLRAFEVFYRLILFIPLGVLLAFLSRRTGRDAWGKWVTTAIAMVAFPLVIELTFTIVSGRFRWADFSSGIGLIWAAILITNSDRKSSYIE